MVGRLGGQGWAVGQAGHGGSGGVRVLVRAFSTGGKASGAGRLPSWLTVASLRAYGPQIAVVGGVCVVVYGLSKIMVSITSSILSLDLYDAFYLGFTTGISATVLLGLTGAYLWRKTAISPDAVLRRAFSVARQSSRVMRAVGTDVRLGALKAQVITPGHFSVSKRFAWVEPRAQLMFNITGDKGDAVVTAEGLKINGAIVMTSVAVDAMPRGVGQTPTPQLFILKGGEDKLHTAGHLRGFLQLDRATFVPQDKGSDDDDRRLDEQARVAAAPHATTDDTDEGGVAGAPAPKPRA